MKMRNDPCYAICSPNKLNKKRNFESPGNASFETYLYFECNTEIEKKKIETRLWEKRGGGPDS